MLAGKIGRSPPLPAMTLPAVVQSCQERAVRRAGAIVQRAGTTALEAMQADAQRRDAARELQLRLPAWRNRYGELLARVLQEPEAGAAAATPTAAESRFSSLTLVDDTEVLQTLEGQRFAQQLRGKLESSLGELDARMSSALGCEGIRPERNPLRPEIFARALARLMTEDQPHPDWPGTWMRAMADIFAQELGQFYAECCALLAQAGVQAAGYRVVNKPGAAARHTPTPSRPAPLQPQAGGPHAPPDPAFGQAVSAFMKMASQALQGPFVREFLTRDAAQMHEPLPPTYQAQLHRELAALHQQHDEPDFDPMVDLEHEPLPPVDRPPRAVATDSPLERAAWGRFAVPRQRAIVRTQLKTEAEEVGQAIAVDLVRKLLDQVAQDPRLLAPVREAMVALEPALGRLALHSPRFFGAAANPARALLEQVGERSFHYNDQFSAEFQEFFEGVRERFNALNADEDLADAQPFEEALDDLQTTWAAQDQHAEAHTQALLAAVQAAERRQAEADEIALELAKRSDLQGVPGVVQDFLFERWALVIAHARAAAGGKQVDPGGYIGVITDLLWSVRREQTLREPARAFELIPRVVIKLRDGLIRIGQPPGDDDVFFKALERLHKPVMRLRAKHRRQAMEGVEPAEAEELLPAGKRTPREADNVWFAPSELKACGFEDTVLADVAAHRKTLGKGAPNLSSDEAERLIGQLVPGCWVDLYSRRVWRRAQLTWASSKGTLFMFVSQGGRPHSMTRRSLERLVSARLVRTVEREAVVQRALNALALPAPQAMAA
jgi:hypothetical protein